MADYATPNLPSRDLGRTAAFYGRLGFDVGFKDEGWMILSRGSLQIEFFPFKIDPRRSIASCCYAWTASRISIGRFRRWDFPTTADRRLA